jgi:hypothetical protein
MKTDQYIPREERHRVFWAEVSQILEMSPEEAEHAFIHTHFVSMDAKNFLSCVKSGKITKATLEKFHIPPLEHCQESQQVIEITNEVLDELDQQNYKLKQVIEIGDEILAEENRTFLSGGEYITKGEWYVVQELIDNGHIDFTAITSCNMPEERNYQGVWGISVVRRNGVVIFDRHNCNDWG